jgi:hypothetical protein
MDEFFYGTPPQDTQDFSQVLRGVGRSIQDIGRGVSYYPYDLVGAPVDLINMALTPVGLGSERPVLGSDYLRNIAQSLGLAQPSTGSGTETAARFASALINPAAGARAVGKVGTDINRLVSMIDETPPRGSIDFSPRQVSSAQQVAQEIMQPKRSDIGFYSQLEAATFPMQDKGTGDQFLAQIQKTAGVKPDEIKYTGLDEFLKGKKAVTKAEIQGYLASNKVDVQEVRLGEGLPPGYTVRQDPTTRVFEVLDENGRIAGTGLNRGEAISQFSGSAAGSTKFSSYTLPGGENYRELLLTLPSGPRQTKFEVFDPSTQRAVPFQTREEAVAFANQDPTRSSVVAEVDVSKPEYRSSHFDQPNILAHMRVNDRVVDGKKTLFIEEVQSDWHQKGRKKGYATGEKAELPQGTKVFEPGAADSPGQTNQAFTVQIPSAVNGRNLFYGTTREEALANAQSFIAQPSLGAVPDAPFKTTWHELTLKRAIQEASEKGYDQIAFTTGKTQAERYDLSKQVDYIDYKTTRSGPDIQYGLAVVAKNGDSVDLPKQFFTAKELPDIVGKEVADKIIAGQGQPGGGRMTLRGLDLKVGGEGMKGFYDNILPKSLEKLGKKFDAKVGKTEMDGVEVWQMDITPKMRESVTTKGQPLFAVPAVGLLGAGMYQDEQMY